MNLDGFYNKRRELRLIRHLLPILDKLPEAQEEGTRVWELYQVAKLISKYPLADPQFKNRSWTEDWKEFTDIDLWDIRNYYKLIDVEPLTKNEPEYCLISKEQIQCQLELIGVKYRGYWYSINYDLFPEEYKEELSKIDTQNLEELTNYFNGLAVKQYQKFLDEQSNMIV